MRSSRRFGTFICTTLCVLLVLLGTSFLVQPGASAAPSAPATKPRKCRAGWVALTFDDGPSATVTPRLVRILLRKNVPATFFMVGERVATAPEAAKLVAKSGFRIANHSYRHQNMTTQSSVGIQKTLRRTQHELHLAGIKHPSRLMRPPYGAINRRIARAIRRTDFVPVLWNVDSLDWSGGGPATIARRVLRGLDRGGTNIVLQHDGITNSPNSVTAVPQIVRAARKRGFCFTELNARGRLIVPKPKVTLRSFEGREGQDSSVGIRLSHPMPYPTSVYLSTQDLVDDSESNAATGSIDYEQQFQRVEFAPGQTLKVVHFAITPDEVDEPDESFLVNLSSPSGATLVDESVSVAIRDTRKPPAVAVDAAKVVEPDRGKSTAEVRIRLGRASGKDVVLTLVTTDGSADDRDFTETSREVTIPAGQTSVTVGIPVRADRQHEGMEQFSVTLTDVENAWVYRGKSTVTIRDGDTPPA